MHRPSQRGSDSAAAKVSSSSRRPTSGHRVATVIEAQIRRHGRSRSVAGAPPRMTAWAAYHAEMRLRTRGVVMVVAAIVGIVVIGIDAADDGFSAWNAVAIVCFAVVLVYGYLYVTERRPGH
jgi:type IV secretory pathway VirB2 component (pilin)